MIGNDEDSEDSVDIPDAPRDFECPITMKLMKDPVIAADNHTYEREAILKWFEKNNTSPKTGEPLANKELRPNYAVKGTRMDFFSKTT